MSRETDSAMPLSCEADVNADDRWRRFSLAILLRSTTLIALLLGWLLAIFRVPPIQVVEGMILLGLVLALIVGRKRHGSHTARAIAALLFFLGAIVVAIYSGIVSATIQTPAMSTDPWEALGTFMNGMWILVGMPVASTCLVFMLRAWTWSAHDSRIHEDI